MKTLNKSAERGFVRKTAMPCQAGVFATGSMKTFMKNLAFLLLLKFLKKNSHKVVTWIIMSGIPRKKECIWRGTAALMSSSIASPSWSKWRSISKGCQFMSGIPWKFKFCLIWIRQLIMVVDAESCFQSNHGGKAALFEESKLVRRVPVRFNGFGILMWVPWFASLVQRPENPISWDRIRLDWNH